MNELLQQTANALKGDWNLQLPPMLSEEALLQLLADRVAAIIKQGAEPFYQLMYRLDISEKKLNEVLHDADAVNKIARLIYERQLQKVQSRLQNKPKRADDDDATLRW